MQRPCRPRTLAAGPAGSVQQCPDCGVLSIHLGAVTVRMDAAAGEALWCTLGEALHALHGELARGSVGTA